MFRCGADYFHLMLFKIDLESSHTVSHLMNILEVVSMTFGVWILGWLLPSSTDLLIKHVCDLHFFHNSQAANILSTISLVDSSLRQPKMWIAYMAYMFESQTALFY